MTAAIWELGGPTFLKLKNITYENMIGGQITVRLHSKLREFVPFVPGTFSHEGVRKLLMCFWLFVHISCRGRNCICAGIIDGEAGEAEDWHIAVSAQRLSHCTDFFHDIPLSSLAPLHPKRSQVGHIVHIRKIPHP